MALLAPDAHPLLTAAVLLALKAKNVHTLHQFLETDPDKLIAITKLSFKNIQVIRKHIINKNSALTQTADEYYQKLLRNTAIISTGVASLDKLLDQGLCTGRIYEVCGLPATGKTLFCYKVLVRCAEDYNQEVLYLDTKCDFSPTVITNAIKHKDEIERIMSKILVKHVFTIYELTNTLYDLMDGNKLKNSGLRLIVVDSLPSLVCQIHDVWTRNAQLNYMVNVMRFIASQFHVVFVVVNVASTWRIGNSFDSNEVSVETPKCGKYWLSVPDVRLLFSKVVGKGLEIKMLKGGGGGVCLIESINFSLF